MMRTTILAGIAVLALGPSSAHATIIFNSDTATELVGTWELTGRINLGEQLTATNFGPLLPNGTPFVQAVRDPTGALIFGAAGFGNPDNPLFVAAPPAVPTVFADVSGVYGNNPSNTPVYWLFSSIQDTGGADGTFI